ncbi:general odorant-binding protein 70 [Cimex lectularius]|uniref:Odorant binding protein n=1 Tax=Cimex lectularius TaxID=79782 RepID=A0A8I6S872_CIMLE|nr:general odorant-binding protein 70 [Cimex lectularius]
MHFNLLLLLAATTFAANQERQLCQAPTTAPQKLEKVIGQCQDEIKYALLQEALSVLGETVGIVNNRKSTEGIREKREAFSGEEKRIAGCLLQCVYRKMKAVDTNGIPTATGLVKIYSEGNKDRNYYLATIQAVQQCLAQELQNRTNDPSLLKQEGYTCDVAYDMFNCVSNQIELVCGSKP